MTKFEATQAAFFQRRMRFGLLGDVPYRSGQVSFRELDTPQDCFCMVYGDLKTENFDTIRSPGILVEAIVYDDFHYYLTFHSGKVEDPTILRMIGPKEREPIVDISVALICTDDSRHKQLLVRAVQRLCKVLPNPEICVAFFGDDPPGLGVKYVQFPRRDFHMAFARNRALEQCTGSHVFMTDLDCLLDESSYTGLLIKWHALPHNGVLNIKQPKPPYPGNTLTFGELGKVRDNGFDERFKGFWFEDTEYLMNFSRTGIVPWTVFLNFDYQNHQRSHTSGQGKNRGLFEKILKRGYR